MISSVLKWTMGAWLLILMMLPATLWAVEIAPRITDREITEKLARLEAGQEALRSEMKSGQEALRSEMKSGQEALSLRISDLRAEMKSNQESLRAEMKSGMEALGKRLDDLNERLADTNATMLVLFTSLIGLIVALFGYMIWDRRTMMKPVSEKLERFEREVTRDLDLSHSEGSLLKRQLKVMIKFAEKNPDFAEAMRGGSIDLILTVLSDEEIKGRVMLRVV